MELSLKGPSTSSGPDGYRLFVYGTLRPGSPNEYARQLVETARHIGAATVGGRLYRVSHYPALAAPASKEDRVRGDVFEGVTTALLQRLDEYEGAEYKRQLAEVAMEDGRTFEAYCYCYVLPTEQLECILSGDWLTVSERY